MPLSIRQRHMNLMYMRKKGILLIFTVLLISPIVVNFLLSRNILWNYDVVGEGKDWIAYYGSLISSFVAFYILYQTLLHNRKITLLSHKHDDLIGLKRDIAERITGIDLPQVIQNILFIDNFDCSQELLRLNNLSHQYTIESNAVLLVYGKSDDKYASEFCNAYCTFIDNLIKKDINEMTKIVIDLRSNSITKEEYKQQMSEIANRITGERQHYFTNVVYPAARNYVKHEEKLYCQMENNNN